MKIEAIFNKGPASMGPEVMEQFNWAERAYIASAFITSASLERIEDALRDAKKNERHLQVQLLVGLYQRFVSASAISKACALHKKYPDSFSIRIARNERFHWKLYIFARRNARKMYVGSANFTEDGLTAPGELSVRITAQYDDKISESLESEFETIWGSKRLSFLPDKQFLKDYKRLARRPRHVRVTKDDPISRLLYNAQRVRRKRVTRQPVQEELRPKPRLVYTNVGLSQATIDKISKYKNNWDEQGWGYICFYKQSFEYARNASFIVHVTHSQDKIPSADDFEIGFYKIADTAELKTPDGKYFIAISHIPYSRIVRYGDVKGKLRGVGLTWKKLKSDRFLNETQVDTLCELLRMKLETLLAKLE